MMRSVIAIGVRATLGAVAMTFAGIGTVAWLRS